MPTPTGSPTTFTGFNGKLEFAPTSGPKDPNPVWVDITNFIRSESSPLAIIRGRQSELDTIQSSQLTCILDNTDLRFTFGNTTGPYGSGWQLGKQVRYTETVNGRVFYQYNGHIEAPDITDWQPIGYQEVSLSCTDDLTWLSRQAPAVSTLGAHIMFNGRSALKAYYPLGDTTAPALSVVGAASPLRPVVVQNAFGFNPDSPSQPAITFANGAPPLGDDLQVVTFQPSRDSTATHTMVASTPLTGPIGPFSLAAGQVLTVVAWVNLNDYAPSSRFVQFEALAGAGFVNIGVDTGTNPFKATGGGSGWGTTTVDGAPARTGTWTPVAARMGFSPATAELWVKDDIYTGVMATAGPTTTGFDTMTIGNATSGSVGHVQVYIGAPSDWSRTDFLAQVRMGFTGLEYQTTGQRINTLLDYAGFGGGARAIDPGVSYMQRAQLAGENPGTSLANAVATERGRGFIDGQGRYVFHDRTRIYNV